MTDQNKPPSASLTPTPQSGNTTLNAAQRNRVSLPSLHARLRNPQINLPGGADPCTMPNRLALLLDCSGSMRGPKIKALRDACTSFIQACNFGDTALALETFGEESDPPPSRVALTTFGPFLMTTVAQLHACGQTPMAQAMDYVIHTYSLTRSVLVSDGQPNSESAVYKIVKTYQEAGLPCDCVHIGDSSSGEACLRCVAEMTGGQFIKFTDITSFAHSFKYLTPAYYDELTSGNVSAAQLGAKELK